MKVNDPNLSGVPPGAVGKPSLDNSQQTQAVRRHGPARAGEAGEGGLADQVALSSLGARLRASGVNSPERTARLERLSADVRAGRYHVDARELSQRLIEDALKPGT